MADQPFNRIAPMRPGRWQILAEQGIGDEEQGNDRHDPARSTYTLIPCGPAALSLNPVRRKGPAAMQQPVPPPLGRGYFAIGAERISKALNLGNLMRSAHGLARASPSQSGQATRPWRRAPIPRKERSTCHITTGRASPSWPYRTAAVWWAWNCWTKPSICRAFAIRCAPPTCSDRSAGLSRRVARPLRLPGAYSLPLLHQLGDGWRHRHVRPCARAWALSGATFK